MYIEYDETKKKEVFTNECLIFDRIYVTKRRRQLSIGKTISGCGEEVAVSEIEATFFPDFIMHCLGYQFFK